MYNPNATHPRVCRSPKAAPILPLAFGFNPDEGIGYGEAIGMAVGVTLTGAVRCGSSWAVLLYTRSIDGAEPSVDSSLGGGLALDPVSAAFRIP